MQSYNTSDLNNETPLEVPLPSANPEPDFTRPCKLIADLVGLPDFPKCALGEHVDIGGYAGVVVDIVGQSLKVRSAQGGTQGFNAMRLRSIYGRAPRPEIGSPVRNPEPPSPVASTTEETVRTKTESPVVQRIPTAEPVIQKPALEPDYSSPSKPIAEFVDRADFPKCALGEHVDIGGYAGVVMDIVGQSLKVRSEQGTSQGFNAIRLRALYGKTPKPEPESPSAYMERSRVAKEEPKAPAAPVRNVFTEPDFTKPAVSIKEFARRADFPQCTFGQHVDINGDSGVVIEIVKQSLRIMSPTGSLQNYNGPVLKKLYGQG